MTKNEQREINAQVLDVLGILRSNSLWQANRKQLRSCSAYVCDLYDNETGEVLYHVLTSYSTIVAVIDARTDTLYDFLRYVYGYTSTSAQHISKFSKDYGLGKWGCANVLRYYPV